MCLEQAGQSGCNSVSEGKVAADEAREAMLGFVSSCQEAVFSLTSNGKRL